MALLTQSRFPGLWRLFQYWIGGTVDKRSLCLLEYNGQERVLEVGCSLGNIARAFLKLDHVEYTGIDIDPVVIEYARRSFASRKNFTFVCEDLREFSKREAEFGYVLFAGVGHHLDDEMCQSLLASARRMLEPRGRLVVVDPLLPRDEDSWFLHKFMRLEQGRYLRTGAALRDLLEGVPGLALHGAQEHLIGSSPFHRPTCARIGVYTLGPR